MNFMFSMPTFVQFGCGVSKQIGDMLADAGHKRVLFVYDGGVKAAGIADAVAGSLKTAGLQYLEYGEVLPNPPDYQVQAAAALAKDFKTSCWAAAVPWILRRASIFSFPIHRPSMRIMA